MATIIIERDDVDVPRALGVLHPADTVSKWSCSGDWGRWVLDWRGPGDPPTEAELAAVVLPDPEPTAEERLVALEVRMNRAADGKDTETVTRADLKNGE